MAWDFKELPYPVEFRWKPNNTFEEKEIVVEVPYEEQILLEEFPHPNKPMKVFVDGVEFFRADSYPPPYGWFFFDRVTCSIYLPFMADAQKVRIEYSGVGTVVRASHIRALMDNMREAIETLKYLADRTGSLFDKISELEDRITNAEKDLRYLADTLSRISKLVWEVSGRYLQINTPADGTYSDGLFPWIPETRIADAFDEINEYLVKVDRALGEHMNDVIDLKGPIWMDLVSKHSLRRDTHEPIVVVRGGEKFFMDLAGQLTRTRLEYYIDGTLVDAMEFTSSQELFTPKESELIRFFPKGFTGDQRHRYRSVFVVPETLNVELHNLSVNLTTPDGVIDTNAAFALETVAYPSVSGQLNVEAEENVWLSGYNYTTKGKLTGEISLTDFGRYTYRSPNVLVYINGEFMEFTAVPTEADVASTHVELPLPEGVFLQDLKVPVYALHTTYDFSGAFTKSFILVEENIANVEFLPSTQFEEFFFDERYRIPLDYTGEPTTDLFNSYAPLAPNEARVVPGRVQREMGGEGEQHYVRFFAQDNPYSNGVLRITGVFEFGQDLKVHLMVPGKTGWLSLHEYFDSKTFDGSDGQGCLVKIEYDEDGVFLHWSIGENVTNTILVKLTLSGIATVTYLGEVGWKEYETGA